MPTLDRLSITEDDPTISPINADNSTSDPENGKNSSLSYAYFSTIFYYSDNEQDNQ
jgi:hypothetical protein